MFSEWKQIAFDIRDGAAKQNKLIIFYLIWSFICTYWGIWNFTRIYNFYELKVSMADLLILQQHQWNFGIMILPLAVFVIMKCKHNCLNIQFVLRYGSRKRMMHRQLAESVFYAAGMILFLLGTEIFILAINKHPGINWNCMDSLFYAQTGTTVKGSFLIVLIGVGFMYFVKIMLVLGILDILLWYPKYIVGLWILLIVAAGVENLDVRVFHQFFSFQYEAWLIPNKYLLTLGFGTILIMAEHYAGFLLIKKRDIFN